MICQGCARDLHALSASGLPFTSPPIGKNSWVLAAERQKTLTLRRRARGESLLPSNRAGKHLASWYDHREDSNEGLEVFTRHHRANTTTR